MDFVVGKEFELLSSEESLIRGVLTDFFCSLDYLQV